MNPDHDINEEKLSEQLQRLLESIEASGRAILPGSNDALLKSIVETATRIFGAAAASILLADEEEGVLVFRVSTGDAGQGLVGRKFPSDKGIAGYVFMTGMPMATSNVKDDKRFNQDFAQSTGYVPDSILATPLTSSDDRIIGVMEILDKIEAASFDIRDMELAGIFAQQASMAIDQSQQIEKIEQALVQGLRRLARLDGSAELASTLDRFLNEENETPDLLDLADLFNQISALGSAERKACLQVLNVFAEYRQSTSPSRRLR
jgi:GAF domain-containing protein